MENPYEEKSVGQTLLDIQDKQIKELKEDIRLLKEKLKELTKKQKKR
jgi:hypothetical protein